VHRLLSLFALLLPLLLAAGCGATKQQRKESDAHYMLGVSYLREQNATLALKEFLRAEENAPDDAELQNALGQAYQLKKAYAEAEKHYLRALKLSRDNPAYQNNLAALYLDMERWDDAIRLFRKAADNLLFGNPEIALTGMGYAYHQKGEYLDAVTVCKQALKYNPRYAQAQLRLGEAYYALDKTEPAVQAYQEALAIAPDYALAHYRLGQAYMKQRNTGKAVAAFREVRRLAPDSELAKSVDEYLKILK